MILPRDGTVIAADDGGGRAAYMWKGVVGPDPSPAAPVTTARALLDRYAQQMRDAGLDVTTYSGRDHASFDYLTTTASPLAVHVRTASCDGAAARSDPESAKAEGARLEILVSIPGG